MALSTLHSAGAKLLQLARSTPGVAAVLVGHKSHDHVEANHEVSEDPRLGPKRWQLTHEEVVAALHW